MVVSWNDAAEINDLVCNEALVIPCKIGVAVAGLASLSVFVPADLLKCRAQQQKEGRLEYFKEINTVLGEQGVKGMYRGFGPVLGEMFQVGQFILLHLNG